MGTEAILSPFSYKNMSMIIGVIVGIIVVLMPVYFKLKKHEQLNQEVIRQNIKATEQLSRLKETVQVLDTEQKSYLSKINFAKDQLETYQNSINSQSDSLQTALESYAEVLDSKYALLEKEWDNSRNELEDECLKIQTEIAEAISLETERLNKIRATRAAIIEAQVREKEIREKLDFYCLKTDLVDESDIQTLTKIKSRLNKPRILSMLIWQTYYQKSMTQLCNNVLGAGVVTGIYKITNQITNQVYVGQARDVSSRWKEHAKCGLDIDRPQGNKLYQAMVDDGLQNFSWELLEKCNPEELNEKERYYIEIYRAFEYGYNSTKGNK